MTDEGGRDFEPGGRVPGRPAVPKPPPADASPNRLIGVEITPRQIRLTPGELQTATIEVQYLGRLVDELTLSLSGAAAGWTSIVPDVLNLYPGTPGQSTIRFAPPRSPQPPAGLLELELTVSSRAQPAANILQRTPVEILPFDQLDVSAERSSISGAREASLPIRVRNLGNRAATVTLRTTSAGTAIVSLSSEGLTLPPGGEDVVWATVRPQRDGEPGRTLQYPFAVSVGSQYTAPQTVEGRMEQVGPAARRSWAPIAALAALGGLAIVVVVGALLFMRGGPAEPTAPAVTPTLAGVVTQPVITDVPATVPTTTTAPVETTAAPPPPTTLPPTAAALSFGERAAGSWNLVSVNSPFLAESGYPASGFSGRLDVAQSTSATILTWWWPATLTPEVLTCHGTLDGDVLLTNDDPETDLQRVGEVIGYPLDARGAELVVAELCGVTADVLPDGPITADSYMGAYLVHNPWRVILGGDDLTTTAPTLEMKIDVNAGDVLITTDIQWTR